MEVDNQLTDFVGSIHGGSAPFRGAHCTDSSLDLKQSHGSGTKGGVYLSSASCLSHQIQREEDGGTNAAPPPPPPPPLQDHLRQESWYMEMLDHGLSSQDIANMLGGDDHNGNMNKTLEKEAAAASNEAMLNQRRILAISEAHRRLTQRLGNVPLPNANEESTSSSTSSESDLDSPHVLFPFTAAVEPPSAITQTKSSKPLSTPTRLFSFDPQALIDQTTKRCEESDLQTSVALCPSHTPSRKVPAGYIAVRCLGCRKHQIVSRQATLLRCPLCSTVSPASSTRK